MEHKPIFNPLKTESPDAWNALMNSIGPASLLAVAYNRMGSQLRDRYMPEDVLQEVFLHAWRDRNSIEWRGERAFRSWLLTAIDNRIRDLVDFESAQKRGGSQNMKRESDLVYNFGNQLLDGVESATPSWIASYREQAEVMRVTLEGLPEELRMVVWMRLFEQRGTSEIARELEISEPAVRNRLRKGSGLYQRRLLRVLASTVQAIDDGNASLGDIDPLPFNK